jgi:hypothetical protein
MERATYRRFQAAAAFPATEVRQLPPRRTVSEEPVSSFWCVEKIEKKKNTSKINESKMRSVDGDLHNL